MCILDSIYLKNAGAAIFLALQSLSEIFPLLFLPSLVFTDYRLTQFLAAGNDKVKSAGQVNITNSICH